MRGIIENIKEKIAVKGNKYLVIKVNKLNFSVFDDKLFGILRTGAEISYDIEPKGKYKNIIDIKLIKGVIESAVSETTKPSVGNYTNGKSITDQSIELQVCFKGAIELFKDKEFAKDGKKLETVGDIFFGDLIITTTKKFYSEIFQDRENIDKSPEISKMMSGIISKMTEVKGLFSEEEFDKSRNVIESHYKDYDRIKKLYDWVIKEFDGRIAVLKKENVEE